MKPATNTQQGFSLIELLIGLAIGLVGLFAVSQIMLSFNKQRTTINQTMTTQNNGVMALYLLERDLSQAGYGMAGLACDRINYSYNGTGYYNNPYNSTTLPGAGNVALTALPVRIHNSNNGLGSDVIEVQYGRNNSGIPGAQIIAAQASYAAAYSVAAATGFSNGDMFIAYTNGICTLAKVSAAPTVPDPSNAPTASTPVTSAVPHSSSVWPDYNVNSAPGGNGWNSVAAADLSASPGPFLANMGTFVSRRFAVNNNALTLSELPALDPSVSAAPVLVDDIMFIKAQYGLSSSAGSTAVATWASADDLATTGYDSTKASRIVAVRVGVVARSPLLEKDTITDAPATLSVLPPITGTSSVASPSAGNCVTDTATWEVLCTVPDTHYRYRSYSTIIPLKNVIWTR
ncbi:MAG: prepilin-type N-terminal cleavage/methylation domain-containing protein [Rhodocyclaceae bacterium]|nr:MAG: prepilin-type N-terminal cleavage/methylation domain-containing protein [Rhodocyclaceae bacterium]